MKFTLWKDNQRNEAKPFGTCRITLDRRSNSLSPCLFFSIADIGVPILPRFFLVTSQSGVKSMTLSLDGAQERQYSQNHTLVECPNAIWTYKYINGYMVTLKGPLKAHLQFVQSSPLPNSNPMLPPQHQSQQPQPIPPPQQPRFSLKFDSITFDANLHEKSLMIDAIGGARIVEPPKTPRMRHPATPNATPTMTGVTEEEKKSEEPRILIEKAVIPAEPVNAFGVPQATMRCLEVSASGNFGILTFNIILTHTLVSGRRWSDG